MKITEQEKNGVRFSKLNVGDTFIYVPDTPTVYMKVEAEEEGDRCNTVSFREVGDDRPFMTRFEDDSRVHRVDVTLTWKRR